MHILASGGAPPLPGFLNSLAGPLGRFGYWAVLLLVMLEDSIWLHNGSPSRAAEINEGVNNASDLQ